MPIVQTHVQNKIIISYSVAILTKHCTLFCTVVEIANLYLIAYTYLLVRYI